MVGSRIGQRSTHKCFLYGNFAAEIVDKYKSLSCTKNLSNLKTKNKKPIGCLSDLKFIYANPLFRMAQCLSRSINCLNYTINYHIAIPLYLRLVFSGREGCISALSSIISGFRYSPSWQQKNREDLEAQMARNDLHLLFSQENHINGSRIPFEALPQLVSTINANKINKFNIDISKFFKDAFSQLKESITNYERTDRSMIYRAAPSRRERPVSYKLKESMCDSWQRLRLPDIMSNYRQLQAQHRQNYQYPSIMYSSTALYLNNHRQSPVFQHRQDYQYPSIMYSSAAQYLSKTKDLADKRYGPYNGYVFNKLNTTVKINEIGHKAISPWRFSANIRDYFFKDITHFDTQLAKWITLRKTLAFSAEEDKMISLMPIDDGGSDAKVDFSYKGQKMNIFNFKDEKKLILESQSAIDEKSIYQKHERIFGKSPAIEYIVPARTEASNPRAIEKYAPTQDVQKLTAFDLSRLTDQVYSLLERKIKIERERRGLYS